MVISFRVTESERDVIDAIVKRAFRLYVIHSIRIDKIDLAMDITATHANGNPLKLEELLAADDFNFVHDVFGIRRHIDRETGLLDGRFSPRFSK